MTTSRCWRRAPSTTGCDGSESSLPQPARDSGTASLARSTLARRRGFVLPPPSSCYPRLISSHVCSNGNRSLAGALFGFLRCSSLKRYQVHQSVDSEWSLSVSVSVQCLCSSCRRHLPESLVPDGITPPEGTFEEDLDKLQSILEDEVPAYILARLDEPPSEWLAIYYVPDSAKVRDKVRVVPARQFHIKINSCLDVVCCHPEHPDQVAWIDAFH